MNKLRTIEAGLQMLSFSLTEKHNTSRHYMWHFIAGLSAVRDTDWAEKKIKAVPHVFWDSAEVYQYVYTSICGDNWHDGNKNNLRTIEAPIVQKLKSNKPQPNVTGSYKKKCVLHIS